MDMGELEAAEAAAGLLDGQQGGGDSGLAGAQSEWTEEEWVEWNSWWRSRDWDYSSWRNSTGWTWDRNSQVIAESEGRTQRPGETVNTGSDTHARSEAVQEDWWLRERGRWQEPDKWWSHGSQRGDYSDPPAWGGWGNYRLWKKAMLRWNGNTDVAVWRRAEKLLKLFDWELQSKLDHIPDSDLSGQNYLQRVFEVMDVLAGEKETSERRRCVRAALYEGARRSDESLAQYTLRREAQFSGADKYLSIPEELKAFMLEEQSGLNKQGIQNLRVLTGGKQGYQEVKHALKVLDTEEESLFKASGKSYFLAEQEDKGGEAEDSSGSSDDDGQLIFLALEEQQLGEEDASSFLADWPNQRKSWKQNKLLKAARRKDRRHFDDRDSRPARPGNKRRLSIEELKKVTRCANCQQKGHWKEDCTLPYKPRSAAASEDGKNKGKSSPSAFVFFGNSETSQPCKGSEIGLNYLISLAEINSSWLSVPAGHAIIDPGASQDLIGLEAFHELSQKLQSIGLKPVKLAETPSPAAGIGGKAKPLFNVLVPCCLGGFPGIVKLTVLEESIPHLISIGLLEMAKSVIDTDENVIMFKAFQTQAPLIRMSSGHRLLDVTSWKGGEFPVPDQVSQEYGVKAGDFNTSDARAAYDASGSPDMFSFQDYFSRVMKHKIHEDEFGNMVRVCFNTSSLVNVDHQLQYPFRTTWLVFGENAVRVEDSVSSSCSFAHCSTCDVNIPCVISIFSHHSDVLRCPVFSLPPCIFLGHDMLQTNQQSEVAGRSGEKTICSDGMPATSNDQSSHQEQLDLQGLTSLQRSVRFDPNSAESHGWSGQNQSSASELRARSRGGTGSMVPVGGKASSLEVRRCQPSSSCTTLGPTNSPLAGKEDGMPSPRGTCGEGLESMGNVAPVPGMPDEDRVSALQRREPSTAGQTVQASGDLCATAKGSPDHEQGQEYQDGEEPLWHLSEGAGGSLGEASRIPCERHPAGAGTDCPEPARPPTGPVDDGAASDRVSADASSASPWRGPSTGLHQLRRRDDTRAHDESQLAGLGGHVRRLPTVVKPCDVSRILEESDVQNWLAVPISSMHVLGHDVVSRSFVWQQPSTGDVWVLWDGHDLCSQLVFSDDLDDFEFQVTKRDKRILREAISEGSLLSNSPGHFALQVREEDNPRTSRKEQYWGEDPKTSRTETQERGEDPSTSKEYQQQGEDLRTSRDVETCHESYLASLGFLGVKGVGDPDSRETVDRAVSHGRSQFKLCELFSPPRITKEAVRQGYLVTSPSAFDKEVGWQFFDAECRAQFWQTIREQKPDLIVMTPECKPFSQMMESNWSRLPIEQAKRLQTEGLAMLHFCVQVAEFQLQRGRYFLLEQPGGASSWATHALKWLLEQKGVIRFLFDQCAVGLTVRENTVSRKTTGIATNHIGIAYILSQRQCTRDHDHLVLEQGLTSAARIFPPQLIQDVLSGVQFQLADFVAQSFHAEHVDSEEEEQEEEEESHVVGKERPSIAECKDITADEKRKVLAVHVNLGYITTEQMLSLLKAAGAKQEVMHYVKPVQVQSVHETATTSTETSSSFS